MGQEKVDAGELTLRLIEPDADEHDGRDAARPFEQALETMFAWWVQTEPGRQWSPPGFADKAGSLLRRPGNRNGFVGYLNEYEIRVHQSQADGSMHACSIRSRIQVLTELEKLFQRYLGAVTFSLVTPEDIGELDEELAAQLPHAGSDGFALRGAVPEGVPDGHWWWRAPFTDA